MKEKKKTGGGPEQKAEQKFSKGQLLSSAKYRSRKDLVSALLDDGKTYTTAEVEQMIDRFMKGKVK